MGRQQFQHPGSTARPKHKLRGAYRRYHTRTACGAIHRSGLEQWGVNSCGFRHYHRQKRILTFDAVSADSLTLRVDRFRGSNHNAVLESARFIELPSTLQAGNATLARLDAAKLTLPGWLPEIKMFEPMIATIASPTAISGFTYTPNAGAGKIFRYRFYTWDNATNRWIEQPTTGEFSNIENNPIEQVVYLADPVVTDRVMLLPLSEATGKKTAEISAFGLLTD